MAVSLHPRTPDRDVSSAPGPGPVPAPPRRPIPLAGAALVALVLGTLAEALLRLAWAGMVADLALVAYFAAVWRPLPWSGRLFLLTGAGMGFGAVLFAEPGWPLAADALRRARSFVTLFTALNFLRAAAETSAMIKRCGRHLLAQPPGRRYLALTAGGNLFGLIVGFGALNLLGTMVKRANTLASAGGDPRVRTVRERRSMLALMRGFSCTTSWNPISLPMAILLSSLPALHWTHLLPFAFATNLGLLALGWAFDRFGGHARGAGTGMLARSTDGWAIHLNIVAIVALVFAGGLTVERLAGVPAVVGVMLAAPLVATGWQLVQAAGLGPGAALLLTGRRFRRQVRVAYPRYRLELAILAGAALVGTFVAGLLPATAATEALSALGLPAALLPLAVVLVTVGTASLGVNPIATVTILAASLPQPESVGLSSITMGVAYLAGWALAVGSSPFALTTLITGSLVDKPSRVVAHVWNGAYTLAGMALLGVWLLLLAVLLPAG